MSDRFRIEALGRRDRSGFSCGTSELDRYLREQASQDVKRLVASCFIAIDEASDRLAGFYTLSATSFLLNDVSIDLQKRLPRYPVLPAALIGRLAVDIDFHRRGLGQALLVDAAERALRSDVKAFAIVVDAKDAHAVSFYERFGFQRFSACGDRLYLPLQTIRKATPG